MYATLLLVHSIFRWFVLFSLLFSIYRGYIGYVKHKPFSKGDNAWRHWTATIAHIQLVLGVILYVKSPLVQYFWAHFSEAIRLMDTLFFGLVHFLLMLGSVVVVTIGSALAKRKASDLEKHKTMLIWFGFALLLIIIAIPWPFSPLANRPYFRTY